MTSCSRGMRMAKPNITMRTLRTTFVDEFGGVTFAFDHICNGQDIRIDDWTKALRHVWVTPSEAERCFGLFDLENGALTKDAFERTMRATDAVQARQTLVEKLIAQHGIIP